MLYEPRKPLCSLDTGTLGLCLGCKSDTGGTGTGLTQGTCSVGLCNQDGSCTTCSTAAGTGVPGDAHTACPDLNPLCVAGTCACGGNICDTKSSICDGVVGEQACKCGPNDICGVTDPQKIFCYNKGDTEDANDECYCSGDATTPGLGDGNTQGSCIDDTHKCRASGECAGMF